MFVYNEEVSLKGFLYNTFLLYIIFKKKSTGTNAFLANLLI